MSRNIIIAIDGPAASGKSTIAKAIADRLNFTYVDTGAMYRAITYSILQKNILGNQNEINALLDNLVLKLDYNNGLTRVYLNGEEVTNKIRTQKVNSNVSEVSRIPEVRKALVRIQKELGSNCSLVAEGRDTTTVVFPEADVKIYLTASIEERSRRRFDEFLEDQTDVTLDEVKENLSKRDQIDSSRKVSPLTKAEDAIEIDTTVLSVQDEMELILNKVENAIKNKFDGQLN